jgi:hypothetical protein
MAKKQYILTIEYNKDTEQIEYLQEEIVNCDEKEVMIEEINEYNYWDEDSIRFIRKYYEGEIGES